ncbi:MAG: phospholipase [Pedobacter sp.]|nr:MAG: phospholipase [Pedobacter sp.]
MTKKTFTIAFLSVIITSFLITCKSKKDESEPSKTYRFTESITVDGRARSYVLNLPPNYYEGESFSMVIAMHGGGGDALQFEASTRLTEKANASKFIVVYPEGVKSNGVLEARTWNAGACCDFAVENKIDDVKFISLLIDKLVSTYKINAKKVYATGHSNGGMLSYRLACEIGNKIAAIAPNGCSMVTASCNPARPMPILHMHSALDTKVPAAGGFGSGVGTAGINFTPIVDILNFWSGKNTCSTTSQVLVNNSNYKFTKWSNCIGNNTIQYYLTTDGGHAWPGGLQGSAIGDNPSKVINANDLLWDFFQQYQLP